MTRKNSQLQEKSENIEENLKENLAFYTRKQKQALITSERTRLNNIFRSLPEEKKKVINPLIDELAFMCTELKDLKQQVHRDGAIEKYRNGANQYGKKKSAAVDIYNTMLKNYSAITKQLGDLLPKENEELDDGFDEFLNNE